MDELLNELNRFREIRANATDPDTIKMAEAQIAELESKLGIVQQKQAAQEQKFDELKNYVESLDLNTTLNHPDAAKIVHALLYEQGQNHLDELSAKDLDLAGKDQLVEELQQKVSTLESVVDDLDKANQRIKELETENQKLSADIEETRKDARYQLNEANRLKQLLQSAEHRLAEEKQRRSDIKPSESLQQLLEGAKAVTDQRKVPITNVQPANEKGTHYTAQNADTGEQLTIPHYAMGAYEQVERLRIPEEDPVTEAEFPSSGEDVAGADVVQANAGDTQGAGDDAEVPEAAAPMSPEEISARFQRIENEIGLKTWKWDGEA